MVEYIKIMHVIIKSMDSIGIMLAVICFVFLNI